MFAPCLKLCSWYTIGPIFFPAYCTWLAWFGFFQYNTKSLIQATYTLWVFLLCAAQLSNSLERQDWPSCSCPPLVLMQSELYSWKKYLPRHTLCAWRSWSRAEGCLLNPDPFQNSFLVTLYQNNFQQCQSNHWVWITTLLISPWAMPGNSKFPCPRNLL